MIDAIMSLEDGCETREEYAINMQRAINSGQIWLMQGSMGRAAMDAIESGICMLGATPCFDFYGNRIPSRTEVKSGTKGSPEFVTDVALRTTLLSLD